MKDVVMLLSGGMDSGVLLALCARRYEQVHALCFDYGSRHAKKEIEKARALAIEYKAVFKKIDLPFITDFFTSSLLETGDEIPDGPYGTQNMESTVVPFRNAIMLSIAVGYAEEHAIGKVLIASHAGDHAIYPDCTPEFTHAMSEAATSGTSAGVRIEAPFESMTKARIAEQGRKMGFDFTKTWSCYKGLDIHCGICATCLERKHALGYDKGDDPTRYQG